MVELMVAMIVYNYGRNNGSNYDRNRDHAPNRSHNPRLTNLIRTGEQSTKKSSSFLLLPLLFRLNKKANL